HNMHDFYKTLETTGMDPSNLIISKQQHPTFPGLYEVYYRIPSLTYGPDGKLIPSGQYKVIPTPKTVYDPNVYTDAQMIQWGKEAMEEGLKMKRIKGRVVTGFSQNGMKFRGFINDQGEITNFFPTFN
ncbi:EndoU nuclease-like protein, partial [Laceyella sediminis]